ncbi:MAG TPA: hypothetical protein DD739_02265 [Ochrobactrum anthropi]|nr:hypothetical protein [Brucella anthropi]
MTDDSKHLYAHFRADILWMIQPILASQQNDESYFGGDLIIEPCDLGGCIIIAISRTAMAVFRDPSGYCTTAMSALVPEAAFEYCKPHAAIPMSYCGQQYSPRLPEWSQAGDVVMHSAGMFVGTKMRHPDWMAEDDEFYPCLYQRTGAVGSLEVGIDYKAEPGRSISWRAPLTQAMELPAREEDIIGINPGVIGLFERIHNTVTENRQNGTHFYALQTTNSTTGHGPIILRMHDYPDFVGVMMPMSLPKDPQRDLPEWLTTTFPETQGGVQ